MPEFLSVSSAMQALEKMNKFLAIEQTIDDPLYASTSKVSRPVELFGVRLAIEYVLPTTLSVTYSGRNEVTFRKDNETPEERCGHVFYTPVRYHFIISSFHHFII